MPLQLRFIEGTGPTELADAIAVRAWDAIAREAAPLVLHPVHRENFGRVVRDLLGRRMYGFDTCGLYRTCVDAASPAEWNDAPRDPADRRAVRFSHLSAPEGLEGFKALLVGTMLAACAGAELSAAAHLRLRETLGRIVRQTIGPLLYEGLMCETPQIMRIAETAAQFERGA